jgi:uncharacterized membrane protein YeaQ/YmgE (transglycosylase-associated protein family)
MPTDAQPMARLLLLMPWEREPLSDPPINGDRRHHPAPPRWKPGSSGALRERNMAMSPGGIIAWLLVGLIAGWLAGQFMKGGGFGLIGDIVMGIIGAFIGGLLFAFLLPGSAVGMLGSIVVAFIGAVILILAIRALPGRSPI